MVTTMYNNKAHHCFLDALVTKILLPLLKSPSQFFVLPWLRRVSCLVNMESRQENHNRRVFECFYQS